MIRGIVWGLIIASIGAWIWISSVNPGYVPAPDFRRDWPLILVVLGLTTIGDGIAYSMRRKR